VLRGRIPTDHRFHSWRAQHTTGPPGVLYCHPNSLHYSAHTIALTKNVPPPGAGGRGPMTTALLLIAHGSRQAEANADLDHVAEGLRRRGRALVETSFLELAEPTIDEGGRRCVAGGARRVVLVPYFLSAGVHVRRDLTAARERLAERFPGVE